MNFFDTLTAKTKALGDSAKLNVKINEERHKIADYKARLGELTWKKYESGAAFDDADILGLLVQLKAFYANIDKMNAEIEQIKIRSAESRKANEAKKGKTDKREKQTCPKCGVEVSEGQKFCGACGAEIPDCEPKERRCEGCGAILGEGQEFCTQCGRKYQ